MYDINIIPGKLNPAERVKTLPIIQPYKKIAIFKTQLKNLSVGEKLFIHTDAQVTTPYTYNVMLACDIAMVLPNGTVLKELCEGQGQNFNKEEHHFNWPRIASFDVDKAYPEVWILHRAWAASTAAASGHKLTVDQDAGRLTIWRFTPVSISDLKVRLGL
jgi:hypothetical protein